MYTDCLEALQNQTPSAAVVDERHGLPRIQTDLTVNYRTRRVLRNTPSSTSQVYLENTDICRSTVSRPKSNPFRLLILPWRKLLRVDFCAALRFEGKQPGRIQYWRRRGYVMDLYSFQRSTVSKRAACYYATLQRTCPGPFSGQVTRVFDPYLKSR